MKYKFLHVPKTGGTVLKNSLIDNYRVQREDYLKSKISTLYFCNHEEQIGNDSKYILFVRDPIDRIISHYVYFRYRRAGYDTDHYYTATTPEYLKHFRDTNEFAWGIDDFGLRPSKLHNGFEFALRGLKGLEKYRNNLFFVGRTEHLEKDFYALQDRLGVKDKYPFLTNYANKMPPTLRYRRVKIIRDQAKAKLRRTLDKEYQIIKRLCDMGFIDKSYLDEINYENIS